MVKTLASGVLLVACGVVLGIGIDRGLTTAISAQQREGRRGPRLPTAEELPQEVATLRQLLPTRSSSRMR